MLCHSTIAVTESVVTYCMKRKGHEGACESKEDVARSPFAALKKCVDGAPCCSTEGHK